MSHSALDMKGNEAHLLAPFQLGFPELGIFKQINKQERHVAACSNVTKLKIEYGCRHMHSLNEQ